MTFTPAADPRALPYAVADAGNGTILAQFPTLAQARAEAQPGQQVLRFTGAAWSVAEAGR